MLISLSDRINIFSPFINYAIISTVNLDLFLQQVKSLRKELLSSQALVTRSFFNMGIGPALQTLPLEYWVTV